MEEISIKLFRETGFSLIMGLPGNLHIASQKCDTTAAMETGGKNSKKYITLSNKY